MAAQMGAHTHPWAPALARTPSQVLRDDGEAKPGPISALTNG